MLKTKAKKLVLKHDIHTFMYTQQTSEMFFAVCQLSNKMCAKIIRSPLAISK